MVLAQKETHRAKEQNRESRNKPVLTRSINLQQRRQEHTMGKRQVFSVNGWGNWTTFLHQIQK